MKKDKPRDTRMPREHWDRMADRLEKFRSTEIARALYEDLLEKRPTSSPIYGFEYAAVCNVLFSINYFYSRGDSLDTLRSTVLATALENAFFVQEVFDDPGEQIIDARQFFSHFGAPCSVHSAYTMLSWCVCLDADVDTMRKLARTIAEPGADRLVDTVLQRYDPERVVAAGPAAPRVFGLLDRAIDADPAGRIALLSRYLDNWGKFMGMLKGRYSLGGGDRAMRAKSNSDLEAEKRLNKNYLGWWAWEVALVVRVLGVDDSSFADHVLYPVDLARYRNTEQPVDLWPIVTEVKVGEATVDPMDDFEENDMIAELLVVLDLAVNTASPVKATELQPEPDREEEYYLYVAVDSDTGVYKKEPLMVNTHVAGLSFTASTTADATAREMALESIERVAGYLEANYDNYPYFREEIDDGDARAMLDHLDVQFDRLSRGAYLPIASGPDWATWIDVSEYKSGTTILAVEYVRVSDDQLLIIRGVNSGRPDLTVGEFVRHWESLVERYGGRAM